ncbi:acyltransferase family-domain-containing protein [Paraphysoderma sedebokerense]|nr:acyltransferase family-domain-containing protein [Paraphysoderma sedebokerense]
MSAELSFSYQTISPHIAVTVSEETLDAPPQKSDEDNNQNCSASTLADETAAALLTTEDSPIQNIQQQFSSSHLPYRPDIDGIRTIAVGAVVFFHAYRHLFPGGFIGVDIFFVISGYLITGIIFKQHQLQKFTYREFYSRRIRRIFPSLLLVMISTLFMGCLWLRVINLEAMVSSLVAGTIFGANIQIMTLKGGYFDPDVDTNPLLHLWSLGVEEQFYIIWPFLAGIVIRSPTPMAILILFAFISVSFGLNVGLIAVNSKLSFYFPLCRFWQMAYTALVSSSVGLCLIILGFIFVNEDSVFPGWWSLLPTVGAAFLIYAGPEATFNKYVLGSRVFIFIGKISYPLYLWHWPLLVYAKELYPIIDHRPVWAQPFVMVILASVFSIITYYFVEDRVRHNKSKLVVPILSVLMVVMVVIGIVILTHAAYFSVQNAKKPQVDIPINPPINAAGEGTGNEPLNSSRGPRIQSATLDKVRAALLDWQYPPPAFVAIPHDSAYASSRNGEIFNPGQDDTIVVLGDSHANMVSHRFVKLLHDARNTSSTFPTIVYKTKAGTPSLPCDPDFASNIALIKGNRPKVVLIITDWPRYIRPGGAVSDPLHINSLRCCEASYSTSCPYQSTKDADEILRLFFNAIKEVTSIGIKVFVATINPEGDMFYPGFMYDANGLIQSSLKPVNLSWFRQRHISLIQKIENGTMDANATIIDFAVNMCWNDSCEVLDPYGNPIMGDTHHFRPFYARDYLDVIDMVIKASR